MISSVNSLFEEREIAAVVTTFATPFSCVIIRLVLLRFGELSLTPGNLQRGQVILDISVLRDVPETDRHLID